MNLRIIGILFFSLLTSNLYPTIWLSKPEIKDLIALLNRDEAAPVLDFSRDIVPVRIGKFQKVQGRHTIELLKSPSYGFFVNVRDIFNLEAVRRKSEEGKRNALRFCIDAFARRVLIDEKLLSLCYECLALPIPLDVIFIVLDILLTPIHPSLEREIKLILEEASSFKSKVDRVLNLLEAHCDVIDRNLLCNYIAPGDKLAGKKQVALCELETLRDRVADQEFDEAGYHSIMRALLDLFKIVLDIHVGKVEEVKRFLDVVREGKESPPTCIAEYPTKLWCDCERITLSDRIIFVAQVVSSFSRIFPSDVTPDINYLSWGTGYFLQDCLIVRQLLQGGYRNVTVSLIDLIFDPRHDQCAHVLRVIDRLKTLFIHPLCEDAASSIIVTSYPDEENFFLNEKELDGTQPTLLVAVDISVPTYTENPSFNSFVEKCRKHFECVYVLTLNDHEIAIY